MVRPRGTPSTGRHRIEMSLRPDKTSRQVTFSKRRSGLFKKCSELSLVCGAQFAAIVFSEAGNLFALGSPSVDAVLRRYAPLPASADASADDAGVDDDREALEDMCRAREAAAEQVAAESARMDSIGDEVIRAQGDGRFWWEADAETLGEVELPQFARALKRLRDNVGRHVDKLALEDMCRAREAGAEQVAAESTRMDSIGDEVIQTQGGRRIWWEANAEALEEVELSEFARALEGLRDHVGRHVDKFPLEDMCRAREVVAEHVAAESAQMDSIGDEVIQARGDRRFWWEADAEAIGEAELPEFARALERLRDNVGRHVDKLTRRAPAPATAVVAHPASNYYLAY